MKGTKPVETVGIIALVILILFCLVGIVLTPLGMPGNFIIIAGALVFNLITWEMTVNLQRIAVVLGLAVLGEILEYILGVQMARKRGASGRAIIGAIVGGIIGALVGTPVPIVGTIIGLFVGVFLGAFAIELAYRKDIKLAYDSAIGAFYGRAGAILVKTMIGILIIIIIFVGIF